MIEKACGHIPYWMADHAKREMRKDFYLHDIDYFEVLLTIKLNVVKFFRKKIPTIIGQSMLMMRKVYNVLER